MSTPTGPAIGGSGEGAQTSSRSKTYWYATGRRKTAVARVFLYPGDGKTVVNGRQVEDYFPRETMRMIAGEPLSLVGLADKFNVRVTVRGGGLTGQAEAVRHGIARALLEFNPELRSAVKVEGMLTRDSRTVERKKYGQKGARARFQFSKR